MSHKLNAEIAVIGSGQSIGSAMGSNRGSKQPRSGCITTSSPSRSPTSSLALLGASSLMVEHSRQPRFKPRNLQRELPLTRRGLRENQKRDGGSVFPAHANPGDPHGPLRPVR